MKYLKLFEAYKETTNSINVLMSKFESDKDKIINQYKELIDDLLLDISDEDDYKCEFLSKYEYLRKVELDDNFLRYRISFPIQKIDDFFEKLEDVLNRIVDAGIDYTIDTVNNYELIQGRVMTSHIGAKQRNERHPYCISTSKNQILNYQRSFRKNKEYCLYISF